MLGTWNQIIYDTFLATVGVVVVAAALEGFGRRTLNIFDRIWAFVAGICLIVPDHRFEAVGLILAGAFLASNYVGEIKSLLGMRSAKPPA
jgi:TRAP-type uncharacterized transport system fused permease subunit